MRGAVCITTHTRNDAVELGASVAVAVLACSIQSMSAAAHEHAWGHAMTKPGSRCIGHDNNDAAASHAAGAAPHGCGAELRPRSRWLQPDPQRSNLTTPQRHVLGTSCRAYQCTEPCDDSVPALKATGQPQHITASTPAELLNNNVSVPRLYLKFSTVRGTTSLRRVISILPAGWPPMAMSKNTTGLDIVTTRGFYTNEKISRRRWLGVARARTSCHTAKLHHKEVQVLFKNSGLHAHQAEAVSPR